VCTLPMSCRPLRLHCGNHTSLDSPTDVARNTRRTDVHPGRQRRMPPATVTVSLASRRGLGARSTLALYHIGSCPAPRTHDYLVAFDLRSVSVDPRLPRPPRKPSPAGNHFWPPSLAATSCLLTAPPRRRVCKTAPVLARSRAPPGAR